MRWLGSLDPRPPVAERNSILSLRMESLNRIRATYPSRVIASIPIKFENFKDVLSSCRMHFIGLTWKATVFEVLAAVLPKIEVFWDVIRGRVEKSYCMAQCLPTGSLRITAHYFRMTWP